ncbi:MAG: caspase family protein [Caldilineaceae bacterium]
MTAYDPVVDLKQQLAQGNVCAFVGAGLSVGAGLPGWYDLIHELAQRSGQEMPPPQWASGDTLMRIAQTYVDQHGLNHLIRFLKDRLDTTGKQPTAAHRALAQLPLNLVFTANYDDLLERAFREAGKRVEVVVRDGNIPFMARGEDRVNIVKLYGDLNQPETVVLAQAQYERFFQERPELVKLLEVELGRSTLLYLGWSHTDPYFNLVMGQMLNRYQGMMRRGYAAMFDMLEPQRAELRRKQIHLVDLPTGPDKTTQLATWLAELQPTPEAPAPQARHLRLTEDAPDTRPVLNSGKAWAVLVGINHYEDAYIADLHAAVGDVTALHGVLAREYQAVRLLTDETPERLPTRANLLAELATVAQAAGEGDLLLFHFSGHGIAEGGESYLLPRDARLANLRHTGVAMKDVRELLEQSPARAKVIILDACHSGASLGRAAATMTPQFIQRVFEEAEGMALLASCKGGQQSWEWREQGHGVFTYFLLEALRGQADWDGKGFVTVSDAGRYVTDGVKGWSVAHNAPQTPTLHSTVAGDIILVRLKTETGKILQQM